MSKKTSVTKMLTLVALSAFIVISTILGMIQIVIPAIINGYHITVNTIANGVASVKLYFIIHPNMQIVWILGLALLITATFWILANVFNVKWAQSFFNNYE